MGVCDFFSSEKISHSQPCVAWSVCLLWFASPKETLYVYLSFTNYICTSIYDVISYYHDISCLYILYICKVMYMYYFFGFFCSPSKRKRMSFSDIKQNRILCFCCQAKRLFYLSISTSRKPKFIFRMCMIYDIYDIWYILMWNKEGIYVYSDVILHIICIIYVYICIIIYIDPSPCLFSHI